MTIMEIGNRGNLSAERDNPILDLVSIAELREVFADDGDSDERVLELYRDAQREYLMRRFGSKERIEAFVEAASADRAEIRSDLVDILDVH